MSNVASPIAPTATATGQKEARIMNDDTAARRNDLTPPREADVRARLHRLVAQLVTDAKRIQAVHEATTRTFGKGPDLPPAIAALATLPQAATPLEILERVMSERQWDQLRTETQRAGVTLAEYVDRRLERGATVLEEAIERLVPGMTTEGAARGEHS